MVTLFVRNVCQVILEHHRAAVNLTAKDRGSHDGKDGFVFKTIQYEFPQCIGAVDGTC